MITVNTKDLDYFMSLVELRKYTRVAATFSVSQPAVTQAVKRLEREFEVELVTQDRAHQQTHITRAGQLLYKNAQKINKQLQLAHVEINDAKQERIKFGLPPIIGMLYFPQVAGKLLKSGILQQTDVVETGSGNLISALKKGEINIALLGSIKPLDLEEFTSIHLGKRPFNIIASPDNPISKRSSVKFAELKDQDFINLDSKYVHPLAFKAYSESAGVTPRVTYTPPDIAWVKGLVAANLGISLIVKDVVNPTDRLVSIPLEDEVPERFNISIAIRKDYPLTDLEDQFVNVMSQIVLND